MKLVRGVFQHFRCLLKKKRNERNNNAKSNAPFFDKDFEQNESVEKVNETKKNEKEGGKGGKKN